MKNVLVTAIGTSAATAIVTELKKHYERIHIIGTDINEAYQVATSKDVDEFYKFPSAVENREKYCSYVLDFCLRHEVGYVFSTIDEEVYDLTQKEALFSSKGIRLCMPDAETVRICHLKNVFCKWIENNVPDIAIKTYSCFESIREEYLPLFIKPVEGRASIGCRSIDTAEELAGILSTIEGQKYIIQEKCCGEIITVDIVRDKRNRIINLCQRKESLRNGNGCGIAVEIVDDRELDMICKSLAERLDLDGVVNAEFFKTPSGYKIIEVNPRFSAGTMFSCMSGVNTVCDAFSIANDRCIQKTLPIVGKRFARRYETYEL